MIYDRAKDDNNYVSTLSGILIHINSVCSRLNIPSPSKMPIDNTEAKRFIRNFFSDLGGMCEALKKAYCHGVGIILLFASSSETHRYFHDHDKVKVDGTLRADQVKSLMDWGTELGLTHTEIANYLAAPNDHQESIIKSIVEKLKRSFPPRLFISYSHHDLIIASKFVKRLAANGIACFHDKKDIGFGEQIRDKIHSELETATHLILLLSPQSIKSQWVAYEASYAQHHRIPIVIYLTESSLTIPTFLGNPRAITSSADEKQFLVDLRGYLDS